MAALEAAETVPENPATPTPDAAPEGTAPEATQAGHAPFRFSTPAALTPARQESLETWHKNFLRGASSSLTDFLRLTLELELEGITVQSYAQFIEERGDNNQSLLFR